MTRTPWCIHTSPPVSVCSTDTNIFITTEVVKDRSFSWKIKYNRSVSQRSPLYHNSLSSTEVETTFRIYLESLANCLHPKPIRGLHLQSPHSISNISSTGILTCCPSDTPFSLSLGSTNPWLTDIAMETLDIRRAGFSPALRYSSQHSHFYTLQQLLTGHLRSLLPTAKLVMYRTLPYHPYISKYI